MSIASSSRAHDSPEWIYGSSINPAGGWGDASGPSEKIALPGVYSRILSFAILSIFRSVLLYSKSNP